jgi:hypothetical protein
MGGVTNLDCLEPANTGAASNLEQQMRSRGASRRRRSEHCCHSDRRSGCRTCRDSEGSRDPPLEVVPVINHSPKILNMQTSSHAKLIWVNTKTRGNQAGHNGLGYLTFHFMTADLCLCRIRSIRFMLRRRMNILFRGDRSPRHAALLLFEG